MTDNTITTDTIPSSSEAWMKGWNSRILSLFDKPTSDILDEDKLDWYRGYSAASEETAKRGDQL